MHLICIHLLRTTPNIQYSQYSKITKPATTNKVRDSHKKREKPTWYFDHASRFIPCSFLHSCFVVFSNFQCWFLKCQNISINLQCYFNSRITLIGSMNFIQILFWTFCYVSISCFELLHAHSLIEKSCIQKNPEDLQKCLFLWLPHFCIIKKKMKWR